MSIHHLDQLYTALLYLCAAGQTVFVVAWFTVPWYKSLVGCALMAKSFSLSLALLALAGLRLSHADFTIETFYKVYIALFAIMFLGISFQDYAILRELYKAKKELPNTESSENIVKHL